MPGPNRTIVVAAVLMLLCWPGPAKGQESAVLVRDGVVSAVLVLPEQPHADEELAARELQDHIEKMSGAVLGIIRGAVPEGKIPVRIGLTLNESAEEEIRRFSDDPAAFVISVDLSGVSLVGLSP